MHDSVYAGRLFYEPSRIHAAAIYCSDGRLGEHFDDFLQNGLHLPRYDRLALPGGPAALLEDGSSSSDSSAAWQALTFLVEVHELHRVLLIAHEGCAFYSQQPGLPSAQIERLQRRDLAHVAARIQDHTPRLEIEAYFARIAGSRIIFEPSETRLASPAA